MKYSHTKYLLFFVIATTACLSLLLVKDVFAQLQQNLEVRTRVGNPPGDTGIPPGQGPTSCTMSPPSGDFAQAIRDQFGIAMSGYGQQHLQWAWEKFCEAANTKFIELVRGSAIVATTGISQQVACGGAVSVRLGAYPQQDLFKFILTHELGHVVRNCKPRATIQYNEHINAYNAEGAVSYYGANARRCTGSDNFSEDYADMIAYYVNPSAGVATARCDPNPRPPNPFFVANNKPLHHNVVKRVLDR